MLLESILIRKKFYGDICNYDSSRLYKLVKDPGAVRKAKREIFCKKHVMPKIKNMEGNVEYNRERIVQVASDFYKKTVWEGSQWQWGPRGKDRPNWLRWKYSGYSEEGSSVCPEETKNTNKSSGLHKMNNGELKLFAEEITPLLTKIFNLIPEKETISSQWKNSVIILLLKKEDKMEISSYRRISLTCNIRKIFAKIFKNRLYTARSKPKPRAG